MKHANPAKSSSPTSPQEQILLRRKEVERRTALSRSRIYALMANNEFPRPIRLGAMSVAWLDTEVREWIASRISDSRVAI